MSGISRQALSNARGVGLLITHSGFPQARIFDDAVASKIGSPRSLPSPRLVGLFLQAFLCMTVERYAILRAHQVLSARFGDSQPEGVKCTEERSGSWTLSAAARVI